MKKIILIISLIFTYTISVGQINDSIAIKFNRVSDYFNNIKFYKDLPEDIGVDSLEFTSFISSFDNKEYQQIEKRFNGHFFDYNASYYVLELNNKIHLISISISNINYRIANKIRRRLSKILDEFEDEPKNFKKNEFKKRLYFVDDIYFQPLCWLFYDNEKKELTFQLSDNYFRERLTFEVSDSTDTGKY